MDHEKPQAVGHLAHQVIHESLRESTVSPVSLDIEYADSPSLDEPATVDERKDRRGESVWRVLNERQANMIAFSGTIGNGLFLGSGQTIALAGPGGAVISYVLMGTVISSVISCLGEMTALMPVNAPMMEFPRRFVDRGVGVAVGWVYWFAYAVQAADQLVAVTNLVSFVYDDGKTHLDWKIGDTVDPAVWVSLFLVCAITINMLPVKIYGQMEYMFGCIKMTFIVFLIVLMFILGVMKPRANAYYHETLGTKYWQSPYTFFNPVYAVRDESGNFQRNIGGTIGTFLNMWSALVSCIFAYTGMDIIANTAAESKALADAESMKLGARKISLRIVMLYTMSVLMASFVVPSNHPFLNGQATSDGAQSIFVIAVVEAGLPNLAHFLNAVYVFSAFTSSICMVYVATRVMHTLALQHQTGPEWITRRLRTCRAGVPTRAVLVSGVLMLVAYLGRTGAIGQRLNELASNCTVSLLIVYCTICATYLCFFRTLEEVKLYGNASEAQAALYDRNHPRYPYKSHGQWLKAAYGTLATLILIIFNGIGPFFENPFDGRTFVASYISIPVFIILILGYKIHKHWFRIFEWGPERSNDLRNAIQAASDVRRGRLEFPDYGLTAENVRTFVHWVWIWMK